MGTSGIVWWPFIPLILFLVLAVSVYIQPRPLVHVLSSINPDVTFHVNTQEMVVALTIDDAPTRHDTPIILDILKENDAKATFFCIGHNIIYEDPSRHILTRMHEEGHELANHMFEDKPSYQLSTQEFEQQLVHVDRLIQEVKSNSSSPSSSPSSLTPSSSSSSSTSSSSSPSPSNIKWFRPGHGFFTQRMIAQAASHGYRTALGSVYPHDPAIRLSSLNSFHVLNRVYPGAVIILHNRPWTLTTLRTVLPQLKSMGYRITTLSDLLQYDDNSSRDTSRSGKTE